MQGDTSHDATGDNWAPCGVPSDFSDAIFARRLREVRETARMTQQGLADIMARTGNKIHRSTIGKIENGERPVTIGEAVQMAGILGVRIEDLVTERPRGQPRVQSLRAALQDAEINLRSTRHARDAAFENLRQAEYLYNEALEKMLAAEAYRNSLAEQLQAEGHQ